ncbi:MAG: DUF5615 family PIN-like protein [Planctomycetota bacterium]
MRFLADESCDFAVVRALRDAGHNILAICETKPRADDEEVIRLALDDQRIVLTEDKDFGQLIYAHGKMTLGVILLRFPASARPLLPDAVSEMINRQGENLKGAFVVVQPGRTRISRTL